MILCARLASSSGAPHPWPTNSNPTPWQIFHLTPGATQEDIKTRYYDLVRRYHPDAPAARDVPASVAHARFQAIRSAYDFLSSGNGHGRRHSDPFEVEFAYRRREHDARVRYRRAHGLPDFRPSDVEEDARNDRILILFGAGALALGIAPFFVSASERRERRHLTAAGTLSRVRTEAREAQKLRRQGIRDQARETSGKERAETETETSERLV